ncbi:50S ribosomal protein L37e [Candidatus Bathyarchaeota archaeon]|nr:50S ribosomal protein L37e [Candidatus Bathyarchaeota archaeon]MDP6048748.1 50S ribosomal protein L37e [Candidatus Bathyarchaeota archaeon]MDP6458708.1 50S ribosomal protein L37e [Candidatus Bathyarchaeota archaeon]MDP7443119.1 50S ribosomal protein L37e [Candidatus Bathyarchaeota archaeon]
MPTKHALHHGKRVHIRCRRCGSRSYHLRNKSCSSCGFGASARIRAPGWGTKTANGFRRR